MLNLPKQEDSTLIIPRIYYIQEVFFFHIYIELEGEAAAAMNKQNQSLQQKPYRQNNRGGFGGNNHYMRGRGGSQQHRPLMQQQPTLAGLNTMHHRQRHQRPLLTQGTMQPLMIGAGVGRPRHQGQRMQVM